MKRPAKPFRSANAGEFSPDASGRIDIKQYYSAGLAFKNVEPVPQAGFRQMGGTWRKSIARKILTPLSITSPTLNAGPHTGTGVVVWTGSVAGPVATVFVSGFALSAGTGTFKAQALIAGVWTDVGAPFASSAVAVSRLSARAPGNQLPVATGLRIVASFSTSATVSIVSVSAQSEGTTAIVRPRNVSLLTDEGHYISGFVSPQIIDFYTAEEGFVGAARLPGATLLTLQDMGFYAEGRTIGVFHPSTSGAQRVFLAAPDALHEWEVDAWPFDSVPVADLGGAYPKTDDVWEIFIRWTEDDTYYLYLQCTVDGETADAVRYEDSGGVGQTLPNGDWSRFATALQTALNALPSLGAGVTVTDEAQTGMSRKLTVTFGGDLSGSEYDFTAAVTNTASVSVLPVHTVVGDTDLEDLFSNTQGWPGIAELVQDRLTYARHPALPGAMALSRAGEYFDLNIEASDSAAAILAKIRSQTSETILALKESKYLLIFTDRGVYFATSRTIDRNQPINVVLASEIGIAPNCQPYDLEGLVYYVGRDEDDPTGGHQELSLFYDDVTTSYSANPESLLATHLVTSVIRTARQKAASKLDAAKGWKLRADGRLILSQSIKSQEIMGYCEWIPAGAGICREIGIDKKNRLWLAVQRGTDVTIELYDMTVPCKLHEAVSAVSDLAGNVAGLPYANGAVVWAYASGYVSGPYTVAGNAIQLDDYYGASVTVGRWQPPRFESMPEVYVTPSEDVIMRPGRIHSVDINVIDTTSIAVGANGETPRNIPLLTPLDPLDAPLPAKTQLIEISGESLPGVKVGTTLVITQTRPGELRVKDFFIGAKL